LLFKGVKFVSHINAGIHAESVREEGTEKDVQSKEEGSSWGMERNA
jgi:hypothetical protein